jgi:hypothetical protein
MDRPAEKEAIIEKAKEDYSKAIERDLKEKFGLQMVPRAWPSVDHEIRLIFFETKTPEVIETMGQARTLLVRAVSTVQKTLNEVKPDPIIPILSTNLYSPEAINFSLTFSWANSWWRYFIKHKEGELAGVAMWRGNIEYYFVDPSREPQRETFQEARSKVANYIPY